MTKFRNQIQKIKERSTNSMDGKLLVTTVFCIVAFWVSSTASCVPGGIRLERLIVNACRKEVILHIGEERSRLKLPPGGSFRILQGLRGYEIGESSCSFEFLPKTPSKKLGVNYLKKVWVIAVNRIF